MAYEIKRLKTAWKDVHALYARLDKDDGLSPLHFAGLETDTAIEAYTDYYQPNRFLSKPLGLKLSEAQAAFESLVMYKAIQNLFDENGLILEEWEHVIGKKDHEAIKNNPDMNTTEMLMKGIVDQEIESNVLKDFPKFLMENGLRAPYGVKKLLMNVDNLAASYSDFSTEVDMARFITYVYQDAAAMDLILNTWYSLVYRLDHKDNPCSKERLVFDFKWALAGKKSVTIFIEGDELPHYFPLGALAYETLKDSVLTPEGINVVYCLRISRKAQKFYSELCSILEFGILPFKKISRMEYRKKVIWENPFLRSSS